MKLAVWQTYRNVQLLKQAVQYLHDISYWQLITPWSISLPMSESWKHCLGSLDDPSETYDENLQLLRQPVKHCTMLVRHFSIFFHIRLYHTWVKFWLGIVQWNSVRQVLYQRSSWSWPWMCRKFHWIGCCFVSSNFSSVLSLCVECTKYFQCDVCLNHSGFDGSHH